MEADEEDASYKYYVGMASIMNERPWSEAMETKMERKQWRQRIRFSNLEDYAENTIQRPLSPCLVKSKRFIVWIAYLVDENTLKLSKL